MFELFLFPAHPKVSSHVTWVRDDAAAAHWFRFIRTVTCACVFSFTSALRNAPVCSLLASWMTLHIICGKARLVSRTDKRTASNGH